MQEMADDLEMLLSEVRKTIQDNRKFLQILEDDAAEADDGQMQQDPGNASEREEEYEEL